MIVISSTTVAFGIVCILGGVAIGYAIAEQVMYGRREQEIEVLHDVIEELSDSRDELESWLANELVQAIEDGTIS